MPKTRALFICPSPYEVGTYFRAFAIAKYLVRDLGYEADLLCTGSNDSEATLDGVRVYQTRPAGPSLLPLRGFNPGEVWKRFRIVRKAKLPYELVYSFEYQPNVWPLASYVSRRDQPLHLNDWCDWYAGRHHKMKGIKALQQIDAWMEEYPRRRVDCLTTICSSLYERAISCGVPPESVMMVREGAELAMPLVSRSEARKRLGIPEKRFLIVSMADQGHQTLVNAVSKLAYRHDDVELSLIGRVTDVDSSSPHVRLPGRISDEELHLWLCSADCAWLATPDSPLNRGRLPHKIGHFRVYGLPLVTTGVTDVTQLSDPDITISLDSAEDFAAKTLAFLGDHSGLSLGLTDGQRMHMQKHALEIFSWEKILAPLFERIERLTHEKKC